MIKSVRIAFFGACFILLLSSLLHSSEFAPPVTRYMRQSITFAETKPLPAPLSLAEYSLSDLINSESRTRNISQKPTLSFLNEVYTNNLLLKAERAREAAVRSELGQADALEIMLSQYAGFIQDSSVMLGVPGMYPFPGITSAKLKIADADFNIAQSRRAKLERTTIARAAALMVELWHRQSLFRLLTQEKRRSERIYNTTLNLYQDGRMDFSSLTQAKVRLSEVEAMQVAAGAEINQLQVEAAYLVNATAVDLTATKPDFTAELSFFNTNKDLRAIALNIREEITQARHQKEKLLLLRHILARMTMPELAMSKQPPFAPAGSEIRRGKPGSALPMVNSQPGFDFYRAFLAQIDQMIVRADSLLADAIAKVSAAVKSASVKYDETQRVLKISREKILPDQQASLDTAVTLYENGSFDYTQLIQAETRYNKSQQDHIAAEKNFRLAVIAYLAELGYMPLLEEIND